MAVRIRKDGTIVCAALRGQEDGDIYIDDETHYTLSSVLKILVTEPWEQHKENALWWWINNIPEDVTIDNFYLTD